LWSCKPTAFPIGSDPRRRVQARLNSPYTGRQYGGISDRSVLQARAQPAAWLSEVAAPGRPVPRICWGEKPAVPLFPLSICLTLLGLNYLIEMS
jgi:hypothetical protein